MRRAKASGQPPTSAAVRETLEKAQRTVERSLAQFDLSFKRPIVHALAILWPKLGGEPEAGESADEDEPESYPGGL